MTTHEAKQYSPLALAFLGDSVYDTMIREVLVMIANQRPADLHRKKIAIVNASFQAQMVRYLSPLMTEEENDIFSRGRNAAPKHTNHTDYRNATGLEAVFGYLYLTGNTERLDFLIKQITLTAEYRTVTIGKWEEMN
jgi:ribonuclease-3 family protein